MSTLRERLIEAREAAKLSQAQLAKLAHCGQTTIASIERGRNKGATPLPMLAHVLCVEALWLVDGKGPKRREDLQQLQVIAAWTRHGKAAEWPAKYRKVSALPCLDPWTDH